MLVVYDLCRAINAVLMAQHEDELLHNMMEIDERCQADAHQLGNADGASLTLPICVFWRI